MTRTIATSHRPLTATGSRPRYRSMLTSCVATAGLVATAALFLAQSAWSEEKDIPKTAAPLMIEARKKPTQPWVAKETYTLDQLAGYEQKADPEYSRYGGITATRFAATGYFYTMKFNGRWWLVDPEGHLCIHKAICCTGPGGSDNFRSNLAKKFGTEEAWAESTMDWYKDLGFNGTAAWSNDALLKRTTNRPVYVRIWSFMVSYAKKRGVSRPGVGHANFEGDVMPLFDPEFPRFVDEYAKNLAASKDDPYLLGHFSDNELPLRPNALDLCLKVDAKDPGHLAALAWLTERNVAPDAITTADRDAFYGHYLDRYYSTVSAAIKKHDPNHLYLGSRLIGVSGNETAMRTYGKYADVLSINWYGAWMLERDRIESWAKWTDKPFIISEWYAKGSDVPGLTNESGAGWLVHTQKERGYYYQNMVLNLLSKKNAVGWHWFRYDDNDPEDLKTDPSNRNSNKGIVNVRYEPYADLTDAMKSINRQAYRLIEFFDKTCYTGIFSEQKNHTR